MPTATVDDVDTRMAARRAKRLQVMQSPSATSNSQKEPVPIADPLAGIDLNTLNLDNLTDDEKIELLDVLTLREQAKNSNKLDAYKPYPKQMLFHEAGAYKGVIERLLRAGNQVGKCMPITGVIDLADGTQRTVGELVESGKPFDVMSWVDGSAVKATARLPVEKPVEPCIRVWLENGRYFDCALGHRVLTPIGWAYVADTCLSAPCLPASSSALGLLARLSDVERWLQTPEGYQACCSAGFHPGDAQPQRVSGIDLASSPSLIDALQHSLSLSRSGGSVDRCTSSGQSCIDRLSSSDALIQHEGQCVVSLATDVCTSAPRTTENSLGFQRLMLELRQRVQSEIVIGLRSLLSPEGDIEGNRIIAYQPIPSQKVYDFTVPETGNYISGGVVHHNTWSAGFETAMHLTGRYPEWWTGKRFNHFTVGWAAGVTSETTRDTVQRILLGRSDAWGSGAIPADCIIKITRRSGLADAVDSVQVRYIDGSVSTLFFKSYEQGREKFQGETLDFMWFDEEPDEDVYSEGKTRTQAGDNGLGGIVYMTFTPLLGMSKVVERFLTAKEPGTHDTNMTIQDALHYSQRRRDEIVRGYPAHERKARAMGEPILGSGRVFPVEEDLIKVNPFPIPWHWPKICGVDFGWDHPAAGVWLAWDRETDTVYVYDCYKQSEQTAIFHAAYIKQKGEWIPVAWPHDGLQHGKQDGVELAATYRKHGANMLEDYAKSENDGNSLEASIGDCLERMQTGRLKVFSHLDQWWNEFKLYHREKGLVVKVNDDIMSAMRYAVMCLRYAALPTVKRDYLPSFGTLDDDTGY